VRWRPCPLVLSVVELAEDGRADGCCRAAADVRWRRRWVRKWSVPLLVVLVEMQVLQVGVMVSVAMAMARG
jgi:hypothetical protein